MTINRTIFTQFSEETVDFTAPPDGLATEARFCVPTGCVKGGKNRNQSTPVFFAAS
jgi:hypothetical protein